MEYFDKTLLDLKSISELEDMLNRTKKVKQNHSLLQEVRDFYSQLEEELTNYYHNRIENGNRKPTTKENNLPL